jgi:hypothetical protein
MAVCEKKAGGRREGVEEEGGDGDGDGDVDVLCLDLI